MARSLRRRRVLLQCPIPLTASTISGTSSHREILKDSISRIKVVSKAKISTRTSTRTKAKDRAAFKIGAVVMEDTSLVVVTTTSEVDTVAVEEISLAVGIRTAKVGTVVMEEISLAVVITTAKVGTVEAGSEVRGGIEVPLTAVLHY